MNKDTTYMFIPITKEVIEKLEEGIPYQLKKTSDSKHVLLYADEIKYFGYQFFLEILLPVEEKQVIEEPITMKELRSKFFDDCTNKDGWAVKFIWLPHNVFEWFKPYLKEDIK